MYRDDQWSVAPGPCPSCPGARMRLSSETGAGSQCRGQNSGDILGQAKVSGIRLGIAPPGPERGWGGEESNFLQTRGWKDLKLSMMIAMRLEKFRQNLKYLLLSIRSRKSICRTCIEIGCFLTVEFIAETPFSMSFAFRTKFLWVFGSRRKFGTIQTCRKQSSSLLELLLKINLNVFSTWGNILF